MQVSTGERVQSAGWLVKQENIRPHRECTDRSGTLTHASRKFARALVDCVFLFEEPEVVPDQLANFDRCSRLPKNLLFGQLDVSQINEYE